MKRLSLLLLLALACVIAPTAHAAARTCRSGHTVYKKAGVRVFEDGRHWDDEWFACGPRTRRPKLLYSATGGYANFGVIGRDGDKVLIEGEFSGEGGGEDTRVGWFDARTSQTRLGELAGTVSNEVLDVVALADGSLGVVAGITDERDTDVRVGYLALGRRKDELRREFVVSVAGGRYAKGSLAFADGGRTLSWKVDGGVVRSAPVKGEAVTCTSGTTLVESEGVRVFEVLPRRKNASGWQIDVLATCQPGATTPRELAVSDVSNQDQWDVRSLEHAGSRVAFIAGSAGVGLIDGSALRFVQPEDARYLDDIAVGPSGPVVFIGTGYGDRFANEDFVARLTSETATTFGDWEPLAALGGYYVAGSLAIGDDGRVTWKTQNGFSQSTPLAGETAIDCASGTTLLDKDALRVFEVLPAGADDARLLACPPGAAAPVQLVTGKRTATWSVSELARENDRVAILAGTQIITFGASAGSARAGVWTSSGEIRDAAVATDGRVALALRSGRKWKINVLGLGAAGALAGERTIARPTDSVSAGTLAFSADGTRVEWRNRAGTSRSAAP